MAYTFNPFTGSFDNTPSTLNGDLAYTTVNANSAIWSSSLNYVPLSGGTMTGKLTVSADGTLSRLNIGNALATPSPSAVVDGDVWITNQNKFAWRSGGNTINAAGLSQTNTFNQPQTIGSTSNASAVLIVSNTGTREAAVFSAQGSSPAIRITQIGSGNALIVEDSANPDATPFVVDSLGSVGIGLSSLSAVDAKLTVIGNISSSGVAYLSAIDCFDGVILKAPNNSKWKIVVTDTGTLSSVAI